MCCLGCVLRMHGVARKELKVGWLYEAGIFSGGKYTHKQVREPFIRPLLLWGWSVLPHGTLGAIMLIDEINIIDTN
jgi:hypothetical protein